MHTAGPWKANKDRKVYSQTATEWSRIAAQEVPAYIASCGENEANARLIAAAPTLLEALKSIARDPEQRDIQGIALRAIAQARGES